MTGKSVTIKRGRPSRFQAPLPIPAFIPAHWKDLPHAPTNYKSPPRELVRPSVKIPVLDWWKGHCERAFIALNPFYRLPATQDIGNSKTTQVGSRTYVASDLRGGGYDAEYDFDFFDYSKRHAETVRWSAVHDAVCPDVPFKTFALCVWISSCLGRRDDVPADIQERIEAYCLANALFLPDDDILSPALEPRVGEFLKAAGIECIDIYSEFREYRETHPVEVLSKDYPAFVLPRGGVRNDIYCIHAKEIGLVMAWEFDGVEALIGLSEDAVKVARPEEFFEGFYVGEDTYTDWANPLDFAPRDAPHQS